MDSQCILRLIERERLKQTTHRPYDAEHDARHVSGAWQAIIAHETGCVAGAVLNDSTGIVPAIVKVAAVCFAALEAYPWPDSVAKLEAGR